MTKPESSHDLRREFLSKVNAAIEDDNIIKVIYTLNEQASSTLPDDAEEEDESYNDHVEEGVTEKKEAAEHGHKSTASSLTDILQSLKAFSLDELLSELEEETDITMKNALLAVFTCRNKYLRKSWRLPLFLITHGAEIATKQQNSQRNALHLAAYNNYLKAMMAILNSQAIKSVPHSLNDMDAHGFTPLMCAVLGSHHDVASQLLICASSFDREKSSSTTNVSPFALLTAKRQKDGSTALHFAADRYDLKMMKILVNSVIDPSSSKPFEPTLEALFDMRDNEGNTPLMRSVNAWSTATSGSVQETLVSFWMYCIEKGMKSAVSAKDTKNQQTVIHKAAASGNKKFLTTFALCAIDKREYMMVQDGFGRSPLHLAAEGAHDQVIETILAYINPNDYDLDAFVHLPNIYEDTALHTICKKIAVIKKRKGTPAEEPEDESAYTRSASIVKMLVKAGSSLQLKNSTGETAPAILKPVDTPLLGEISNFIGASSFFTQTTAAIGTKLRSLSVAVSKLKKKKEDVSSEHPSGSQTVRARGATLKSLLPGQNERKSLKEEIKRKSKHRSTVIDNHSVVEKRSNYDISHLLANAGTIDDGESVAGAVVGTPRTKTSLLGKLKSLSAEAHSNHNIFTKRKEAIKQIIESEELYLKQLDKLYTTFYKPLHPTNLRNEDFTLISYRTLHDIFQSFELLHNLQQDFYGDLNDTFHEFGEKDHIELERRICSALLRQVFGFKFYNQIVLNVEDIVKKLKRETAHNPKFAQFLKTHEGELKKATEAEGATHPTDLSAMLLALQDRCKKVLKNYSDFKSAVTSEVPKVKEFAEIQKHNENMVDSCVSRLETIVENLKANSLEQKLNEALATSSL